jgi:hypothetical protein
MLHFIFPEWGRVGKLLPGQISISLLNYFYDKNCKRKTPEETEQAEIHDADGYLQQ